MLAGGKGDFVWERYSKFEDGVERSRVLVSSKEHGLGGDCLLRRTSLLKGMECP